MEKWTHIAREWRQRALGYHRAAEEAVNPEAQATFRRRAEFYDELARTRETHDAGGGRTASGAH